MRRPINWLVVALSLGCLLLGRAVQPPRPEPVIVERAPVVPQIASAVPASLRRHEDLEFGYVDRER